MSAAGVVGFTAEGRTLAAAVTATGEASAAEGFSPEFLPSENPMEKKTAHSVTSPKNRANILPVPRVISVSSDFAVVIATSSLANSWLRRQVSAPTGFGGRRRNPLEPGRLQ